MFIITLFNLEVYKVILKRKKKVVFYSTYLVVLCLSYFKGKKLSYFLVKKIVASNN